MRLIFPPAPVSGAENPFSRSSRRTHTRRGPLRASFSLCSRQPGPVLRPGPSLQGKQQPRHKRKREPPSPPHMKPQTSHLQTGWKNPAAREGGWGGDLRLRLVARVSSPSRDGGAEPASHTGGPRRRREATPVKGEEKWRNASGRGQGPCCQERAGEVSGAGGNRPGMKETDARGGC